jgi:integrase
LGLKADRQLYVTQDELGRVLKVARKASRRDYVLLLLAGNTGMRVTEVVNVQADQFLPHHENARSMGACVLQVRTLKQRGRARTFDELWLHPSVWDAVRSYITFAQVKHTTKGWLFPSRWDLNKHISTRAAQLAFKRHAATAGLDPSVSFHALRHGFGVRVWEATHDQQFVRAVLRHKSITSTSLYIHLSPEKREQYQRSVRFVT